MYHVLCNKQNVTEDVHVNTMIKLLKKSIEYNSDNVASVNRLEELKKEYKL
jgi:hypothetical protein